MMTRVQISEEWAKQIAHDLFGQDLDFAKMSIVFDNSGYIHHCVLIPRFDPITIDSLPTSCEIDFEDIYLQLYADSTNFEVISAGYGPKTNTLIIGGVWQPEKF